MLTSWGVSHILKTYEIFCSNKKWRDIRSVIYNVKKFQKEFMHIYIYIYIFVLRRTKPKKTKQGHDEAQSHSLSKNQLVTPHWCILKNIKINRLTMSPRNSTETYPKFLLSNSAYGSTIEYPLQILYLCKSLKTQLNYLYY